MNWMQVVYFLFIGSIFVLSLIWENQRICDHQTLLQRGEVPFSMANDSLLKFRILIICDGFQAFNHLGEAGFLAILLPA